MLGQTVYEGDNRDVLPTLADRSFELAFVDLPYGLNLGEWDKFLTGLDVFDQVRRLLVDGGVIYATCTAHILREMLDVMREPRIISWAKPNLPLRRHLKSWEWSTEYVLYEVVRGLGKKQEPRVFKKPAGEDGRDYWRIPVENGFLNPDGYRHPARKPVALLRRILEASTEEGDRVLDPFAGSGSTAVACASMGRRCGNMPPGPGSRSRSRTPELRRAPA